MLKTQSMILIITMVSAALLSVAIPSPDCFAVGVPPLSPKPKMPGRPPSLNMPKVVRPGPTTPKNELTKKGPVAEDYKGHNTSHDAQHSHLPHSKKCKDIYGNPGPCPTPPGAQGNPFR